MRAPERAPAPGRLSSDDRRLLDCGEITVRGRMPWASNATLLVDLNLAEGSDLTLAEGSDLTLAEGSDLNLAEGSAGRSGLAVYKPARGERPLWDYPSGLFRREAAVAVIDNALGWDLVPPTVVRDGPFGLGSVQEFVPARDDEHYFTLLERPEHHDTLKAIGVLDLLVNNGDRKSGHCLLGLDGRIRAIDHGLCMHADPKLRTVIWDFAGQPMPTNLVADVARIMDDPTGLEPLAGLVDAEERAAFTRRAAAVLRSPVFPPLRSARSFPWPLV